jgi:hypothetical protein
MQTVRFIEPEVIEALQKRKIRDELVFAQLRNKAHEFRAVIIAISLHIKRGNLAINESYLTDAERDMLKNKLAHFKQMVTIANCKRQMYLNLCDFEQEVYKIHDDELVELTNEREQRLAQIHSYLRLMVPYEKNAELNETIEKEIAQKLPPVEGEFRYIEQKLCINHPGLSNEIINKDLAVEAARQKITDIDNKIQEIQVGMHSHTIVTRTEITDPSQLPTNDEHDVYDLRGLAPPEDDPDSDPDPNIEELD